MSGDKNENNKVVYREVATPLSSYQCPVLNNTNYTLWALRIKKILVANGVWDLVEGTSTSKEIDVKKDSSASAYLFQGLPEDLQMQVAGCETAKEIWDSLKSRFIGTEDVQQAHSQQLKSEFERLVMKEDESIDSFAGKLMSIITKAATCGLTFDEQTKVRKVLNAVPDKFLPVVATIEMIVDFKTVKLEEIIGKLKTYEERIKFRKASQEDNSEKLLLTRQRNNKNYKHNYGNGRRGGGNQTRGRWKDRDEGHTSDESEGTDNKPRRNGDKSQIDCYKCGKLGHYAYEFTEATTKSKLASLNEKLDTLERRLKLLEVQGASGVSIPRRNVTEAKDRRVPRWTLFLGDMSPGIAVGDITIRSTTLCLRDHVNLLLELLVASFELIDIESVIASRHEDIEDVFASSRQNPTNTGNVPALLAPR
ncbi:putative zinc finger, CCHC-type containing protein [Tanacetum coccineum]